MDPSRRVNEWCCIRTKEAATLKLDTKSRNVTQTTKVGNVTNIVKGSGTSVITIGGKAVGSGKNYRSIEVVVSLPRTVGLTASGMGVLEGNVILHGYLFTRPKSEPREWETGNWA